jgi:hypothetical protein
VRAGKSAAKAGAANAITAAVPSKSFFMLVPRLGRCDPLQTTCSQFGCFLVASRQRGKVK